MKPARLAQHPARALAGRYNACLVMAPSVALYIIAPTQSVYSLASPPPPQMAAATEVDVKMVQCGKIACSKMLPMGPVHRCAECRFHYCAEHLGKDRLCAVCRSEREGVKDTKAQIEAWEKKLAEADVDLDSIFLLHSALSSSGHNDTKCPECACEGKRASPMWRGIGSGLVYYQCAKDSGHYWSPYIGALRDADYTRAKARVYIGDDKAYFAYLKGVAKQEVASAKEQMAELQKTIDLLGDTEAKSDASPTKKRARK